RNLDAGLSRWLDSRVRDGEAGGDALQQIVETEPMFGRNRKDVLEAERIELAEQVFAFLRVDLVDDERDRLRQVPNNAGKIAVGGGNVGAPVDQENDVGG